MSGFGGTPEVICSLRVFPSLTYMRRGQVPSVSQEDTLANHRQAVRHDRLILIDRASLEVLWSGSSSHRVQRPAGNLCL